MHTVTFRQARQFVPILIPIAAATGFDGGTTACCPRRRRDPPVAGRRRPHVVAVLLRRRPVRRRRHPGTARPVRAHRAERPCPRRRGRGAGAAPSAGLVRVRVDAAAGCVAGRRGARNRRGLPRGGRPAAHLRPGPPHHPAARGGPPRRRGGGVRPLRQAVAALCPAGRQLPRRPLRGRGRAVPAGRRAPRVPARPDRHGTLRRAGAVGRRRRRAAAARARVGGRRGGGQLGLPAGAPRRLADRRPRADHPAAHRAGDRPHPRVYRGRGRGHAAAGAARLTALVTGLGDAARRGQLLPLGPRP